MEVAEVQTRQIFDIFRGGKLISEYFDSKLQFFYCPIQCNSSFFWKTEVILGKGFYLNFVKTSRMYLMCFKVKNRCSPKNIFMEYFGTISKRKWIWIGVPVSLLISWDCVF